MTERREEIALLATAVMGFTHHPRIDGAFLNTSGFWAVKWNPWESDADAIGVMRVLAEKPNIEVRAESGKDDDSGETSYTFSVCLVDRPGQWQATSDELRHAICAAAVAWARKQKGGKV